jgi:hypothetical protein
MVIQQRVVPSQPDGAVDEAAEPFSEVSTQLWYPDEGWAPVLHAGRPMPWPSDWDQYVTIDERVENTIGVVFASWPRVDAYGLRFPSQPKAAWFDVGDIQATIDMFRQHANEMLRPLRIGDTFWVRGFSPESPSEWEDLRDITPQARSMTKAAVALAALGAVQPPLQDSTLAAEEVYPDVAAAPVAQVPGGAATARPTI